MTFDFEPVVEIPDHPFEAAIVFLAVMAYPERGAGQIGAPGSEFAGSLVSYMHWQARRHKGLAQFRREMNDPKYAPPQWAGFKGKMNRGLRRLRRRSACYSLHGTRMVNGFFAVRAVCSEAVAEGKGAEVYDMAPNGKFGVAKQEVWKRAIRSARATVSRDVDRWTKSFGLNVPIKAADDNQKAKDLVRRAVRQSLPVLHMAHAFELACGDTGPTLGGWGRRDPALALLMNSEKWIEQAIATAERWRIMSGHSMMPDVNPDSMVRLQHKSLRKNAP